MSYTSHTWVDGETITAAKLNNMEQRIAGESYPMLTVTKVNFASIIVEIGIFAYAKPNNEGGYDFLYKPDMGTDDMFNIGSLKVIYTGVTEYVVPHGLPSGDNVLVFCPDVNNFSLSNISGGMSTTPQDIGYPWGSVAQGYVITGDASFTVTAL